MVLDESSQKVLTDLKRKRGVVKAALTRIATFVNNFDPSEQPISLLDFRQEELPLLNRKFDTIQSEIELLATDETDVAEEERERFETNYFDLRSKIQELTNAEKLHNTTGQDNSFGNISIRQRIQLAPIPLPRFNGNIQDWPSFYDIFKAMVHNDESLSSAQKFYYLRSSLTNQALDLVKSIPISDGNYEAVIQRLKQRYDNKSLIIQSHIKSILESPRAEEASATSLQGLYSHVCAHVAALRSIGQPVEHWDAWLITIIISKLDKNTAHGWQLHQRNTELPKYEQLEEFLAGRCIALESTETHTRSADKSTRQYSKNSESNTRGNGQSSIVRKTLLTASKNTQRPCPCCKEDHKLFACETFKALKIPARLEFVRSERLCFNCFAPFHNADSCKSTYSCKRCTKKHNTMLHFESQQGALTEKTNEGENDSVVAESSQQLPKVLSAHSKGGHVFLATASVLVADNHGEFRKCRIVLDSGSQINFVTSKFASQLQLPRQKTILPVSGIGARQIQSVSSIALKVRSRVKPFEAELVCHVLPTIIDDLPCCPRPPTGWNIPEELVPQLADPFFDHTGTVDLLVGGGIFFELLEPSRVQLQVGTAYLQDTRFGWVVTGEVNTTCLLSARTAGENCDDEFRSLCACQPIEYGFESKANKRTLEESKVLQHFEKTAKRDQTGRFILRLPFKSEVHELGGTLEMARARFLSVERKLQRDEELKLQYVQFMKEYLDMGHMERLREESNVSRGVFYLPHHPVLKLSSLTTKLRVVFDASAKSTSNRSLNDVLMCGPTVQDDLCAILMRFRKHQVVITADVEKMFRQIKIDPRDQDFQRILWRPEPDVKLETYRLTTVTYGTTPASFMATNCLVSLAEGSRHSDPEESEIIQRDFYMDDLMTGANTIDECLRLQQRISAILATANLPLRKWCSNSAELLKRIGKSSNDPLFALQIGTEDIVKSLGLSWKPEADEFRFFGQHDPARTRSTKRLLLSDLNRIFDPLGFLSPVLIKGKIFLQQLWQLKIEWDSLLPTDLASRWERFYQELKELSSMSIPRKCIPHRSLQVEIHGFCDASEEAYGSTMFVRSKDENGRWHSRLLCARTRVAPLKGSTIPRLELNGALTLAQLAKKTAEAWGLRINDIHLWTDSTVVLGWLKSQTSRLKTYVANRVNQILEITDAEQWRHVRTDENPADILSRGVTPSELQDKVLWWNGPHWLAEDESQWVQYTIPLIPEDQIPEKRPIKLALVTVNHLDNLFKAYSSWRRLVSAVAWISRFIRYLKAKKKVRDPKFLTVPELKEAEMIILRQVQAECFGREITTLERQNEVLRSSKIKSLCPFLENGMLLVGGRLENAAIPIQQKHPIVLPADHHVTRLIFQDRHCELLHCGPQVLLAEVRRRFWPLKGRLMARSVTQKCVRCVKATPRFPQPLMAPLPKARVQCSRPFTVTGVDFAGPLMIRSGLRRVSGSKVWISIFICFSTRAVHLEIVEDLTSNAFVAALRRFMSRRGRCSKMYSDNGTNFVGAQKELNAAISKSIPELARDGIEWHFYPPSAPHFGGLWESAVKNAKTYLTKMMGETKLTLGELTTLLCQIEACMNSRPISPLSNDPSDLQALTPAHFLIGGPMTLPPETDISQENPSSLRRWKYVQFLTQTFWKRWHREYLPQCQIRGKWSSMKRTLKKDDVVIIKDDNSSPTKWKLGVVINTHPGNDGIIRVVTIRTAAGTEMRRPVVKLCLLPVQEEHLVEDQ